MKFNRKYAGPIHHTKQEGVCVLYAGSFEGGEVDALVDRASQTRFSKASEICLQVSEKTVLGESLTGLSLPSPQ